jgi:hypothetical protein
MSFEIVQIKINEIVHQGPEQLNGKRIRMK